MRAHLSTLAFLFSLIAAVKGVPLMTCRQNDKGDFVCQADSHPTAIPLSQDWSPNAIDTEDRERYYPVAVGTTFPAAQHICAVVDINAGEVHSEKGSSCLEEEMIAEIVTRPTSHIKQICAIFDPETNMGRITNNVDCLKGPKSGLSAEKSLPISMRICAIVESETGMGQAIPNNYCLDERVPI